jgi:endonuclease/exonuclease/phosphatase (EEP) superfamily protein YafD/outer membrane protein OmpA-like peptidoglycan-associated protein
MYLEFTIGIVALLLSLSTLASLIKLDDWWIRIFDFPRLQIASLMVLTSVSAFLYYDFEPMWQYVSVGVLMLSLVYQAYKILPYTPLWKRQVRRYRGKDEQQAISIIVSNVLTPNKQAHKLIDRVKQMKPHILLTLETDQWWEDQLAALEADYTYTIKKPLDNLYGMHLYSRLEIVNYKLSYLVQEEIPSIEALVKLPSGDEVRTFCLHPMPPSPTESDTSTNRDAEILLVGKKLIDKHEPTLVFGDLNDVAWSNTTRLFQQISGLLDPRIGRGFFSTFHAKYPLFRWPLDHVFHSETFELIAINKSNSASGDYLIVLPAGRDYSVSANSKGFFFYSQSFEIPKDTSYAEIQLDIALEPIKKGTKVVLNNIFFESGRAELKPISYVELNKAIDLLEDNKTMVIEIGGHTDNVGSAELNMKLSEQRAKAVLDYMVLAGIAPERLRSKGYGETTPIATNDTKEGKAKNRRTEFEIVEF